jgi:hypothetical protein
MGTIEDRQAFVNATTECLCDNTRAACVRAIRIGRLEVSLWIFQTDDAGDLGYAVKFKHRGVLAYPGQQLGREDMKAIADGLSWALSKLFIRSSLGRWTYPKF